VQGKHHEDRSLGVNSWRVGWLLGVVARLSANAQAAKVARSIHFISPLPANPVTLRVLDAINATDDGDGFACPLAPSVGETYGRGDLPLPSSLLKL
jgi:hypothetical protein